MPLEISSAISADLSRLCRKRCQDAFRSVAQLLQGEEDVYVAALSMSVMFADLAAQLARDSALDASGNTPTEEQARVLVFDQLCEQLKIKVK